MSARDTLKDLRTTAWRTAGARFNASRRLKRRDLVATFSVSLFALAGSGLAVVERVYEVKSGTAADNYLTTVSVLLGFAVVVVSLIEWGGGAAQKSEAFLRNGESLQEFQRQLGLALESVPENEVTREQVEGRLTQYEGIKRGCPYNHEPIDDLLFRATKQSEFVDQHQRPQVANFSWLLAHLRYALSSIWYFAILWVLLGSLLWKAPWESLSANPAPAKVQADQKLPANQSPPIDQKSPIERQ